MAPDGRTGTSTTRWIVASARLIPKGRALRSATTSSLPSATPATPHDGAAPRAGRLTHEQAIALLDVVSHLVDSLRISSQGLGDPGELGADTRRTLTEPSQMAALVAAMEAVGVDAAVIYAYEQTGILVGDGDEDLWSADELKRWQDAVTAYHRKLAPVRA